MKIKYFKNHEETALAAGGRLRKLFIKHKSIPVMFMSSGGSEFSILRHTGSVTLNRRSVVTVLDERFSEDRSVSNFSALKQTEFYKKLNSRGPTPHFINTEVRVSESLSSLANRFELSLRHWKRANPEGKVIITQGIDADGHTAGIMSYPNNKNEFSGLFLNPKRWVAGYDATVARNKYPLRVTVTMPFLRKIVDYVIFFVADSSKKYAFKKVMSENGELYITPGRIVREMRGVEVFTSVG